MGAFAEGAVIYRLNIVTASGGTTVLTVASESWVKVQGSTTETIELPNALTLRAGREFVVVNESTGAVTVNKNGGDLSAEVAPGRQRIFRLFDNTTSAGIWHETDQIDAHGPLTLHATVGTVDSNLNISANQVTSNEGNTQSTPPIDDIINEFSAASIDFQTGAATTGVSLGTFGSITTDGSTFTKPNVTVGQFTRMVFTYQSAANNIDTSFSAAAATQSALTNAGTLFAALDGVPIGFIDLESTAAFDFKTPGAATNVIENSGVTRFGSGSSAGAAGDTSFKLQSISTNVGKIKKGFLILDSGRELVTYDGVDNNVDLDFNLKTAVNSFGVTAPSASTTYYLYLDLSFLPATTVTVGDPQRVAYQAQSGTTGMFTVLASTPENTDLSRYIPLAVIRTDGSSDYTEFEDLARRRHQAPSVNVSPLVGTILDGASIGTIGMVANEQHSLEAGDFPGAASLTSFYSLDTDANDDSTNSRDFTNSGVTFTKKGFFGNENIASFDGASQLDRTSDTFFNVDVSADGFSFGGWFYKEDWGSATATELLMIIGPVAGPYVAIDLLSSGNMRFADDLGTNGPQTSVASLKGWQHFAIVIDAGTTLGYVNGQLIGTDGVGSDPAGSEAHIGAQSNGTADFTGSAQEIFFTDQALSAAEMNAVYSRRFKNYPQLAGGHILTNESFPCDISNNVGSFYNLDAVITDSSVNSRDLTLKGTSSFLTSGLFGTDNVFDFDGDTHLERNNADINPVNPNFTVGMWIAPSDPGGGTEVVISVGDRNVSSTDASFSILIDPVNIEFEHRSVSLTLADVRLPLAGNVITGQWVHIAVSVEGPNFTLYFNGNPVDSNTNDGNIKQAGTDFLAFGARRRTGTGAFDHDLPYTGRMAQPFLIHRALTDEDIFKIYSSRIDLTGSAASVRKEDQIWHVNGRREDGQTEYKLTDQFLLDNSKSGKIYVNFSGDPGDCVDLKLHDGGLGASTVPVRKFDRTYTATPPATIAHNLPDMPTAFAVLHDDLAAGQFIPLNPVDHLKADATNIYTAGFGFLTIDATHPLRIVACVGTPAIGTSGASSSGGFDVIVVDSATTTTYTASHGQEVLVDSDTAATTVNLPATPNVGDRVRARDGSGSAVTNNITVGRNGSLIESVASDHVINLNRTGVDFVYMNAAQGWIMFDL